MVEGTPTLTVEELSVNIGGSLILANVNFSLHAGTITVLTGRNGSGKSTLMRALSGAVGYSGVVRLRGTVVDGLTYQRSRLGIALLPQDRNVFPSLTVGENMNLAGARTHQAQSFQLFPELAEFAKAPARVLSGGFRRLLAIEMVLAQEPSVLLLDEPGAGLTSERLNRLASGLRELVRENSIAAMVSDHRYEDFFEASSQHFTIRGSALIALSQQA